MINKIELISFRSYHKASIKLGPNINLFIGKNAQGKTNLLEAVFFLSNTRSHRTKNDFDLVKKGEEYARIIIENDKDKLMSVIHRQGKYFAINGETIKKVSDFLGRLNTILFYPNESELFSSSPKVRRDFIDLEIGKISYQYLTNLQLFTKVLKERNKILKENEVDLNLLDIKTKQLAEVQYPLLKERVKFIKYLNDNLEDKFNLISSDKHQIKTMIKSQFLNFEINEIISKYQEGMKRDLFNKVTNDGIHRDDYEFMIDDIEVSKYASQGQSRMILIAIKLALIDFIEQSSGKRPILLLDDVLSELDDYHQERLIKAIPSNIQTIITTTDQFDISKYKDIKIFEIEDSIIKEEIYGFER